MRDVNLQKTKPNNIKIKNNWLVNLDNICEINVNSDENKEEYPYKIIWTNKRITTIDKPLFEKLKKYYK